MKAEKPVFPVDIYRAYRSINSLDRNFKIWTKEDDKILTGVVKKYGEGKWRHLSLYLEGTLQTNPIGKGTHHCFHRWYKVLNPNRSKKRWTLHDDLILMVGQFVYRKRNGKP